MAIGVGTGREPAVVGRARGGAQQRLELRTIGRGLGELGGGTALQDGLEHVGAHAVSPFAADAIRRAPAR